MKKITKSEIRATTLSIKNMVGQILYAIIIPFAGWYADIYSIPQALSIIGITTLIIGVVLTIFLRKNKVI